MPLIILSLTDILTSPLCISVEINWLFTACESGGLFGGVVGVPVGASVDGGFVGGAVGASVGASIDGSVGGGFVGDAVEGSVGA